ncbi:MAG: porin family protein [Flavobacterium sp.]|nr:porin family protein [Flavobacterium sp.]
MQETFEHNISHQLDDFKLQPSPIVWQEVDAALHPKRRRRFVIWWWLSAGIIGISAIGYCLIINQTSTITPKQIAINQIDINQAVSATKNTLPIEPKKEIVIKTEKHQKALLGKPKNTIPIYQQNANTNNNKTAKKALLVNNSIATENTDNVVVKSDDSNLNNEPITPFEKQSDSHVTSTKSNQNIDTSKTNKVHKKLSKQSHWRFTIGGGILETKLTNNSKSLANASASIGNGGFTSTPNNNTQPTITSPKTGFTVQLGIAYHTELGKYWQLQTGLQYQYLTNQHGLKADTTTGFTNSFIADKNNLITNKAHWLQIPITFAYSLQPNSKHQLKVLIGGSLAYVISEQWLIGNTNSDRFYYDASLNNRWLFGVQGGLSYAFSQKLSLAAIASYTLSPIQSQVNDKNHFVQYNLQISTPIRFTNKSSSKK